MALREDHQTLLDVFCHCYGLLLEHLDFLDGAVSAHHGWGGYRLVRECVDVAANRLGSTPCETTDRQVKCDDFLRRVRGAMEQNLQADSPAFAAFSDYAAAVEATSDVPCTDLTEWQCAGEELSQACYRCHLPADAPTLCISVGSVDLLPSTRCRLHTTTQKAQSQGEITFEFASDGFTFADYVNLPFYFFHEYLSHVHSAPTFAEYYGVQGHCFTEGWLLYYAQLAYERALFRDPHPALCYPLHRAHYAEQYFQTTLDPVKEPHVHMGYQQARRFAELAGEARFERVTLLVASKPYNAFDQIPDLHGDFVKRVLGWLRRTATMTPQEREDLLIQLETILDGPTPVRGLIEWLIC